MSGNTGVAAMEPADGSTMAACPFSGANAFSSAVQMSLIQWAVDPTHEAYWVKSPHVARPGVVALEHYAEYTGPKPK